MTIRVTVKNEDAGENRIIRVREVRPGEDEAVHTPVLLKGGESCEKHIHKDPGGISLIIDEELCE